MEKVRVLIVVGGGIVQSIACPDFVEVEIADCDNMEADGMTGEEIDAQIEKYRGELQWQPSLV